MIVPDPRKPVCLSALDMVMVVRCTRTFHLRGHGAFPDKVVKLQFICTHKAGDVGGQAFTLVGEWPVRFCALAAFLV